MKPWPRAIMGRVYCAGRPARPEAEGRAVREGAALIAKESGLTHAEPIARLLAAQVREELAAFVAEGNDPLSESLGDMRRKLFPSPAARLATDPDVNTLSLYVEARLERVRDRSGAYLSPDMDKAERAAILDDIRDKLARRYLRHMRA
ncbi:MAG: hypothetical protein ACTHN4_11160 [Sphingomicrobium sp.]